MARQTNGLVRLALAALISVAPSPETHAALIRLATEALDEIDRLNLELDDLSKRQGGRYLSPQECADLVRILDKVDDLIDRGLISEEGSEDSVPRRTVSHLLAVLSR